MTDSEVVVGAGTFRDTAPDTVTFPHRWTPEGVTVQTAFTGAHLLHLTAAGCVLHGVYREAARRRVDLAGVRVSATGAFDTTTWQSTGITYTVDVDTTASSAEVEALLDAVDDEAEMPRAIRAGASVTRVRG